MSQERVRRILAAFSIAGIYALYLALGWAILGATVGLIAVLSLAIRTKLSAFLRALLWVVGAIGVPWLCLIGFNVIWHPTGLHWDSLWLGLLVGGFVFALAAFAYLQTTGENRIAAAVVGVALAVLNVGGVPYLSGEDPARSGVVAARPVVSQIDAMIVVRRATASGDPVPPAPGGSVWDVSYSVAFAGKAKAHWLLLDSDSAAAAGEAVSRSGPALPGTPRRRPGADGVLMLDVDGVPAYTADPAALPSVEPASDEFDRWLGIAERLATRETPIAVLLQTTSTARMAIWREALAKRKMRGIVASVQRLGAFSLTEAAELLATRSPEASEELVLAHRFRPILRFDSSEKLRAPLDIDTFFSSRKVQLCPDDRPAEDNCEVVTKASQLRNGGTHLRLSRKAVEQAGDTGTPDGTMPTGAPPPPGSGSTIFVHPVPMVVGDRKLLYLDYWWYLEYNPTRTGAGTSCGAGLALPGLTCFDHPSDWEGITVVIDQTDDNPVPVAVQYSQHSRIVRYDWKQLRDYWTAPRFQPAIRGLDDAGRRPLVYIAEGTHASYPTVCRRECRQRAVPGREEGRHNGTRTWAPNDSSECLRAVCLKPLPTRDRGTRPAFWNAYEGPWGERRCILRGYCNGENAPTAPGNQKRYLHPDRFSGFVDARGHYRACGAGHRPCPPPPLP